MQEKPDAAPRHAIDPLHHSQTEQATTAPLAPENSQHHFSAMGDYHYTRNTIQRRDSRGQTSAARPNNTGLPDQLKSGVEALSGLSLDDVKVHYNSTRPTQLHALAYAQGKDIHLGPGQERHLPHEAWHVVQQAQGRVRPTVQMQAGVAVNDEMHLEREADVMGARAMPLKPAGEPSVTAQTGTDEPTKANAASIQCKTVIQLSSASDADAAAASDSARARVRLQQSAGLIESIRRGAQTVDEPDTASGAGPDFNPFTFLGGPRTRSKTTQRQVLFKVLVNHQIQTYQVPAGDIPAWRAKAKEYDYPFWDELQENEQGEENQAMEMESDAVHQLATATGYGGGHMNQNAAKAPGAAAPNLLNGTLTFTGTTAHDTALAVTGTSLHRQPTGTGVGTTRPLNWGDYIAMIGGVNPFKQGHFMSQRLGGDGTHDNLAPFTGSLNGLHSTRVENHVIDQTDAPVQDEYADYSVTPAYLGNPNVVTYSQNQFAAMTTVNQLAAMVTANIITAAAAVLIPVAAPLPAPELLLANTWIANYVDGAFPTSISCDANFIDDAGGGAFTQTGVQQVNITNTF
ncbi:MAG: DUF4157 domain-containing protein [Burkholderiales bacterium]|nr:DUF4157 domain-containing protein [Burkholderiales bacterium]